MLKKYGDIISGVFFLLFSAIIFIASYSIKTVSISNVGVSSAFMPRCISVIFALVSITIICSGVKKLRETKDAFAEKGQKSNTWAVVCTLGLIALYIAFLNILGFIITTSIYLFLQFTLLSDKTSRKPLVFGLVAIIASVAIYYVFVSGFQLMLPAGILG